MIADRIPLELDDGQMMHLRCWAPPDGAKGALVALHGLMSHAGWFQSMGEHLSSHGIALLALDRRGSGAHQELQGAETWEAWVSDCTLALDRARELYGRASLFCWCGGSAHGVLAAARYNDLHRLIYAAPVFYLQAAISDRMAAWPKGEERLPLPFHPLDDFSDEPAVRSTIADDALRWQYVPRRFVAPIGEARRRAMAEVSAIRAPTMSLLATRDTIVDNGPTRALLEAQGEVVAVDACHAMVLEQPAAIAARIASFMT